MNYREAADLEATRSILRAQQAWWEVIGEAYEARKAAGHFATWADGRAWLDAVRPRVAPSPLEQLQWVLDERRAAAGPIVLTSLAQPKAVPERKPMPPIIHPDRQLEIAIASLERRERGPKLLSPLAMEIERLARAGFDDRQISEQLGCAKKTAWRVRHDLGIGPNAVNGRGKEWAKSA